MEIQITNDDNNDGVIGSLVFDDYNINVYGSELDPLFNVTDINVKLLGYTNNNTAKWYRPMINDENYVVSLNGLARYTELGLYKALMKCNKPIA